MKILKQKSNGGYESFGTPNPESTSQVLVALSALGIDCRYDERFIKDGHDLIDGIAEYRLDDGSFCHTKGGGSNPTATVQAFYSLIAFQSTLKGLRKLILNKEKLYADLDNTWAVVAEAIQTILRREGYPHPYEALKALTRTNKVITEETIHDFVDGLQVSDAVKAELKAITPHNYTGI